MNNYRFTHGANRLLTCLAVAIALLALLARQPHPVHAAGPYTVTVTSDGPDSNLGDEICNDGVNGCTLRAAIQQASYDGVPTEINFAGAIADSTISLQNSYGTIIWLGSNLVVNGEDKNITISGQNLNAGQSVLQIQGSSNLLENITIRDSQWDGIQLGDFTGVGAGNTNTIFQVTVYHNTAAGIYVHGSASAGGADNMIQSCLIGASSWSDNTCTTSIANGYDGIKIDGGAANTVISYNQIVCNGLSGIYVEGVDGTSGTQILNNGIGTNGVDIMGNIYSGIKDYQAANTLIQDNTISGNVNDGIWLQGSTGTQIHRNKIGTNNTETNALPNGYDGIAITDNATNIVIGSPTDETKRNIISGNTGSGVSLSSGTNNTILDGNYIGLGASGTIVLPNGLAGVAFNGGTNNALSTGSATVNQFISGNILEGVYVANSNLIFINPATYIGVAGDTVLAVGNNREGVLLVDTSNTTVRAGKVMYNRGAGIAVTGNTSTGNQINPNTIHSNSYIPVDLGNDGHTANGTQLPPGPNHWMQYPELSMAGNDGITGTACPGCQVFIYNAFGNPIADNGGGTYITWIDADATTGDFNYTFPPSVATVSLIACDPATYDCSEMSPGYSKTSSTFRYIYLPLVHK